MPSNARNGSAVNLAKSVVLTQRLEKTSVSKAITAGAVKNVRERSAYAKSSELFTVNTLKNLIR